MDWKAENEASTRVLGLTTAITRPGVHEAVFPSTLEALCAAIPPTQIQWMINLDEPAIDGAVSAEESAAVLGEIFSDFGIKPLFFFSGESNFYQAARRLAINADGFLSEGCRVFYLEDDWRLSENLDFVSVFEKSRCHRLSYVGLSKTGSGKWPYRFCPAIWSAPLFEEVYVAAMTGTLARDPEQIVRQRSLKFCRANEVFMAYFPAYEDVGRQWLKERGIRKWHKHGIGVPVTYREETGGRIDRFRDLAWTGLHRGRKLFCNLWRRGLRMLGRETALKRLITDSHSVANRATPPNEHGEGG